LPAERKITSDEDDFDTALNARRYLLTKPEFTPILGAFSLVLAPVKAAALEGSQSPPAVTAG
jgi:hypothetical protein